MAYPETHCTTGLRIRVDFDGQHVVIEGPEAEASALTSALSGMTRALMRAARRGDALAAREIAFYMVGALDGIPVDLIGQPAEIQAWAGAEALA